MLTSMITTWGWRVPARVTASCRRPHADHLDARALVEDQGEAIAHNLVIVGQQYPDRRARIRRGRPQAMAPGRFTTRLRSARAGLTVCHGHLRRRLIGQRNHQAETGAAARLASTSILPPTNARRSRMPNSPKPVTGMRPSRALWDRSASPVAHQDLQLPVVQRSLRTLARFTPACLINIESNSRTDWNTQDLNVVFQRFGRTHPHRRAPPVRASRPSTGPASAARPPARARAEPSD